METDTIAIIVAIVASWSAMLAVILPALISIIRRQERMGNTLASMARHRHQSEDGVAVAELRDA